MAMPNELLRAARESSPSRILPGEPMSRSELADAANEYLFTTTGERYDLDRHQIARYERGEVRWPSAPYRTALRAVLGADNDASLGFTRGSRSSASTVALPGGATSEGWEAASVIATAEEMTRHDVTLSRRQAITAAGGFAAGAALTDPLQAWLTPRAAAARGTVDWKSVV